MSDNKKQKSSLRLLLVGVVLVSVITVGAFLVFPSDFNRAKNSVINTVKNFDWGWTGLGETKVITINTEKDEQGQVLKITESEQTKSGKTLWDWLELSSKLAVPILLFILGYQFQKRDKKKEKAEQDRRENEQKAQAELEIELAKEQAELEREIAKDNRAEEAIQVYLDNMSKLLLDNELRSELFPNSELKVIPDEKDKLNYLDRNNPVRRDNPVREDNPVRDIARTQTITILRRLEGDTDRQKRIIYFLYNAKLCGFIFKNANLEGVNLYGANLYGVNLYRAFLKDANLEGAYLGDAILTCANLEGANLEGANLYRVLLNDANLEGARLKKVNLYRAILTDANLEGANLEGARLKNAILIGANLKGAILIGANLKGAYLARVEGLASDQIKSACNWEEAIYEGRWHLEKETETWVADNEQSEPDNTNFIEELRKDTSSNPKEPPDCSYWERENQSS